MQTGDPLRQRTDDTNHQLAQHEVKEAIRSCKVDASHVPNLETDLHPPRTRRGPRGAVWWEGGVDWRITCIEGWV